MRSKFKINLLLVIVSFVPSIAIAAYLTYEKISLLPYIPALAGIPISAITAMLILHAFFFDRKWQDDRHDGWESAAQYQKEQNKQNTFRVLLWVLCFLALIFSIWLLWPQKIAPAGATTDRAKDGAGKFELTLVQINDVYEISSLDNGKVGGLARVATIIKQIKRDHSNVYTLLAGDFLSPAALGTIRGDDKKKALRGIQMIDVLNVLPLDLVTFGNHEFDIDSLEDLNQRIDRSDFDWVSTNTIETATGKPFTKNENGIRKSIPPYKILNCTNGDGKTIRLGVLGATINSTDSYYASYLPDSTSIATAVAELKKNNVEIIVALTHLNRKRDKELAAKFPDIKLFIGGHEHKNSIDTVGNTIVAKADANVRTIYIHSITYDESNGNVNISSKLDTIDERINEDPSVKNVVNKWNSFADSSWRVQKYDPCKVLAKIDQPLDGTEDNIRFRRTNLTELIAKAIYDACAPKAVNASIYNSGSIRIDDLIKSRVTVYDIIRVLPYSGKIYIMKVTGALLNQLLQVSSAEDSKGDGCFLQYYNIEQKGNLFYLGGKQIKDSDTLTLAVNDYLAKGRQSKMKFLKAGQPGVVSVDSNTGKNTLRADLVNAVSDYIARHYPKPSVVASGVNKVPCY